MCVKRLHNIYQDINVLILISVSFTNIYVYWILNCVIINCVVFWGLAASVSWMWLFCTWEKFLLSDIMKGVDMSEQIIVFIIFYLFIYLCFVPSIVTLASHLAGFQFSFLTYGYPLLWLCVVFAFLCNSLTKLNYRHFTTL